MTRLPSPWALLLRIRPWTLLAALTGCLPLIRAAPVLPPPPDHFVADRAGVLPATTRSDLNLRLEQFERDTSSQVVVWLERKLPPDTTLEAYVHDVYRHWGIGQAHTNNGVLLAVFLDDHKVRIEVGRGLEGTLPDALAGRIINNEITPRFRANDIAGGVRAGVLGILAAARGEYRGTGTTARDRERSAVSSAVGVGMVVFFGLLFAIFLFVLKRFGNSLRRGQSGGWTYYNGGWGGGWGGGGGSGGGGGDPGGFSGGGGDSGGGGASGSW